MTTEKPSDREDEFFLKMEAERIENLRGQLDKKRSEEERLQKKEQHWMKCPKCGSDLEEVNYGSVMIDKCMDCQGIWLDAGELDLLTEGEAQFSKGFLRKIFG